MPKKCDCEEGLPEWIMSYADMITILMAFFVVMYSMAGSSKDEAKEEAVLRSLREQFGPVLPHLGAFGPGPYLSQPQQNKDGGGGNPQPNKNKGRSNREQTEGNYHRVHTLKPGEQAAVGGIIYFAEGQAELGAEAKHRLELGVEEIGGKPQRIEVRGHTSRRPVPRGSSYRDNWDLAYTRCRATMAYLVKLGIDPKRIRLGVAAENEPVLAGNVKLNDNPDARVEVYMLNEIAKLDPAAKPPERPASKPNVK